MMRADVLAGKPGWFAYIGSTDRRASACLETAKECDRGGRLAEASKAYKVTIQVAEATGEHAILAEALRRLAVVRKRHHDEAGARALCLRSYTVADDSDNPLLAADALNTLGGFDVESGAFDQAHETLHRALAIAGDGSPELRARIEQNLGIIANIRGDFEGALAHYQRSLSAFESARDTRGRATVYHNLGMISADRQLWAQAEMHFARSLELAEEIGDVFIRGCCHINVSEVLIARQRYEEARASAESALRTFDQLGVMRNKADAYKMLGIVYRDTGRALLSESRFRSAIAIAVESGNTLSEAESSRELARLFQQQGRNQDALKLFNAAHRLFMRLDARVDLIDVARKVQDFEGEYLAVVRDWGQSIESADSYTHGHCERVATYALAVAGQLGLDEDRLTTVRLGAYLHDLGKVRVPHEILNKPGRLTKEEFEVIQQHPVYGIEMLAAIEFPWDIKPIIRWHHEKADGTGYPDRLRGDEIPLEAQIVCIADIFDALTSSRSYRAAMTHEQAVAEMEACRHWWREEVYAAFVETLAAKS